MKINILDATIKHYINDKDHGIKCNDIDITRICRLAISISCEHTIRLMQFDVICVTDNC